jgi:molybdopterin-guanine dinucleotide biosynthesis protein A
MIKDCYAYILAGGRSLRMGRNKAFLDINGVTFLDLINKSLKSIFEQVYIVTKKDGLSGYCNIIYDLLTQYSPLSGIYTALMHTDNDVVFIKACDNPIISEPMIMEMFSYALNYDIVVPKAFDGFHPLFAFYSKKILPFVKEMVLQNNFKIISLYDKVNVKFYEERDIKKFDPELMTLRNINTPDEYQKFKSIIEGVSA